jgi:hypothetical protein
MRGVPRRCPQGERSGAGELMHLIPDWQPLVVNGELQLP